MKIYLKQTVFDAALDRIRWLFDEFPNVAVDFSGGKDSTVVLNLALRVAEEKGRLPLTVTFLDQEAEWQTVIDYIRVVMNDPRVNPQWLQMPIRISNGTSPNEPWLYCWDPEAEDKWMRPKEPNSIHENIFGTITFAKVFDALQSHFHPNQKAVRIAGVRCSESPGRMKGLTSFETYKGATWGRKVDPKQGHYTMYPLYDWSDSDVWTAIHKNKWPYCGVYDFMFQHGVPIHNMRVSNLHHETAVHQLFYLQEVEGETWNRLSARLAGVNTAGHLKGGLFIPKELPSAFKDWWEYRDYLIEHLITDPEHQAAHRKNFAQADALYEDEAVRLRLCKLQIAAVLVNDYHGTKMNSFAAVNGANSKNGGKRGALKFGKWKQNADADGKPSSPSE